VSVRWGTEWGRKYLTLLWTTTRDKASGKWPCKWATKTAIGQHSATGRNGTRQSGAMRLPWERARWCCLSGDMAWLARMHGRSQGAFACARRWELGRSRRHVASHGAALGHCLKAWVHAGAMERWLMGRAEYAARWDCSTGLAR
jgi:hypothetical protein